MNLITCLSFGWHLDYELTSQIAMLASTYLTERFVQSFFSFVEYYDGVGWNHSVYIDFQRGALKQGVLEESVFHGVIDGVTFRDIISFNCFLIKQSWRRKTRRQLIYNLQEKMAFYLIVMFWRPMPLNCVEVAVMVALPAFLPLRTTIRACPL